MASPSLTPLPIGTNPTEAQQTSPECVLFPGEVGVITARRPGTSSSSPTGLSQISDISSLTQRYQSQTNREEPATTTTEELTFASRSATSKEKTIEDCYDSGDEDRIDSHRDDPDEDSQVDAEEFQMFSENYDEVLGDTLLQAIQEGEETVQLKGKHSIVLRQGTDEKVKIPCVPENFVPKAPKEDKGEPPFENIDNPGNWNQFVFRAKFNKMKQYVCHCLPAGVTPVPISDGIQRWIHNWRFYYGGRGGQWSDPNG